MNPLPSSFGERLAICSWSLQPANPAELAGKILGTGIRRVQLALDPLRESPEIWSSTAGEFQRNGIAIISGMFGCVGEDYSTLETIRLTGGIAPEATWPQNLTNIMPAFCRTTTVIPISSSWRSGWLWWRIFLPRGKSNWLWKPDRNPPMNWR